MSNFGRELFEGSRWHSLKLSVCHGLTARRPRSVLPGSGNHQIQVDSDHADPKPRQVGTRPPSGELNEKTRLGGSDPSNGCRSRRQCRSDEKAPELVRGSAGRPRTRRPGPARPRCNRRFDRLYQPLAIRCLRPISRSCTTIDALARCAVTCWPVQPPCSPEPPGECGSRPTRSWPATVIGKVIVNSHIAQLCAAPDQPRRPRTAASRRRTGLAAAANSAAVRPRAQTAASGGR